VLCQLVCVILRLTRYSADTMFQVCTGDGWSTDVVRPMFEYRTLQYKQHCLPHDADKTTVPQGRIIEAKMSQKCQDFLSEKSSPWATVHLPVARAEMRSVRAQVQARLLAEGFLPHPLPPFLLGARQSDDWITCLFFVSYFIVAGYFILNIGIITAPATITLLPP
jgi:hypothetical protein